MNKSNFVALIHENLVKNKESIKSQWLSPKGTLTKHFIIDDFLPDEICLKIYNAFPKDGSTFHNRSSFREKKKTSANLTSLPTILSDITYAIQDKKIVELISSFLSIEKIEPDPKLYAGGLSMMLEGDFLNPHIDNSHDADRKRFRRLNLLYYVTPNWSLENGGNFELWDKSCKTPKTIISKFNRFVVMVTNKESWHSVSPVKTNQARCCVSNYYFSEISPDSSKYFHVTSFTGRPEEKLKIILGKFDNIFRNFISKNLKIGRGKDQVNKNL